MPVGKVTAVVAHMDDEILALSAVLPKVDRVIYVTDSATQWAGPVAPVEHYAGKRKEGAERAGRHFGFSPVFMDWPNDYISQLPSEPKCGLYDHLLKNIGDSSLLITHAPMDGHIEHTAVSAYVQFIGRMLNIPVVFALLDSQYFHADNNPVYAERVGVSSRDKSRWMDEFYHIEWELLQKVKYTPGLHDECYIGPREVLAELLKDCQWFTHRKF